MVLCYILGTYCINILQLYDLSFLPLYPAGVRTLQWLYSAILLQSGLVRVVSATEGQF